LHRRRREHEASMLEPCGTENANYCLNGGKCFQAMTIETLICR
jgi:hypothetical protein